MGNTRATNFKASMYLYFFLCQLMHKLRLMDYISNGSKLQNRKYAYFLVKWESKWKEVGKSEGVSVVKENQRIPGSKMH